MGGWPSVVFIHGYLSPSQYQTTGQSYRDYVDYLAKSGIVVLKIDLRGHGQSQGEAEGAYYSAGYVVDVLSARKALATTSFVKEDNIGLWGHSMAGNVVLRAVVVEPTIKAAVVWAGAVYSYTDWQEYGLNDNSYQPPDENSSRRQKRQELFDTHGEFDPQSSFWKQVPATNYLTDLGTAIQIHHAIDDAVVNIGYSRDLNQLLLQNRVPHQLFEYQSGGHNLSGAAFNIAMDRTVSWFQTYLTDRDE
jgi:dipeptidyl aminopeptidase/acylaminoacyl peptidase